MTVLGGNELFFILCLARRLFQHDRCHLEIMKVKASASTMIWNQPPATFTSSQKGTQSSTR